MQNDFLTRPLVLAEALKVLNGVDLRSIRLRNHVSTAHVLTLGMALWISGGHQNPVRRGQVENAGELRGEVLNKNAAHLGGMLPASPVRRG